MPSHKLHKLLPAKHSSRWRTLVIWGCQCDSTACQIVT